MFNKLIKKSLAIAALFSLEFITVWILFTGSLLLFAFIVGGLLLQRQAAFDTAAYNAVRTFSHPAVTTLMEAMSFLGSREFVPILVVIVLVYFIFFKKHRWYSLKIPVVAIGSILLNLYLKYLFQRQRPIEKMVETSGLSFPSGHAMTAFSIYGLLIYFAWNEIRNKLLRYCICGLLLVLIHLISLSRVYLGAHYATDVLAGLAIGYSWLILSILILKRIEKGYQKKINPVIEKEE